LNDFKVDFSGVADVTRPPAMQPATDAEQSPRSRPIHEYLRLATAVEVVNLRYIDGKMSAEKHLAALRILYGYGE